MRKKRTSPEIHMAVFAMMVVIRCHMYAWAVRNLLFGGSEEVPKVIWLLGYKKEE